MVRQALEAAIDQNQKNIPEDRKHAVDCDTWGIGWYENYRLLEVWVLVVGVVLSHDEVHTASWVTGARAPPFLLSKG
jgi:hypothetical protein